MKYRFLILLTVMVLLLGGCEKEGSKQADPAQVVEQVVQSVLPELPSAVERLICSDVGSGEIQLTMQPDDRFGLVRHTDVSFGQKTGFHVYSEGFSGICLTLGDQIYSLEEGLRVDPTALDRLLAEMEADTAYGIGEVTEYEGEGILYTFYDYAILKCTAAEKELGYGESEPANADVFIGRAEMDISVVERQRFADLCSLRYEEVESGFVRLDNPAESKDYALYGDGLELTCTVGNTDGVANLMNFLQYKLERDRQEHRCTRSETESRELIYAYSDRNVLLQEDSDGVILRGLISKNPITEGTLADGLAAQAEGRRQGAKKISFQEDPELSLEDSAEVLRKAFETQSYPFSESERAAAYRQACAQVDLDYTGTARYGLRVGVTPAMEQNDVYAFVEEIGSQLATDIRLTYGIEQTNGVSQYRLYRVFDQFDYEEVSVSECTRPGSVWLEWEQGSSDVELEKEQIKQIVREYLSREAVIFVEFVAYYPIEY